MTAHTPARTPTTVLQTGRLLVRHMTPDDAVRFERTIAHPDGTRDVQLFAIASPA